MKIVSSLMLIVLIASIASAEIMSTGDPIGQGKFAVSGNYVKDSKVGTIGSDDMNMSTWGGNIGYGLTDKLDLYFTAASSNVGNFLRFNPLGRSTSGFLLSSFVASMAVISLTVVKASELAAHALDINQ